MDRKKDKKKPALTLDAKAGREGREEETEIRPSSRGRQAPPRTRRDQRTG
jgi:hypothetical protein